ncbi:MAG TPA: hypothetical protein VMM92_08950 [Thermoanaerobaculia bacterium]|nr:hypothetical protein [Thermoanaerobaculia bacterium]
MFNAEIEAQVRRLTQLLEEASYRTRRSRRSLERELGLAHGYLGNLFRGRTELKLAHILLLSRLLHLDPVALLRQALEEGSGEPPASLAPARTETAAVETPGTEGGGAALDLEQLRDLIRQTFRDEVRKLGGDLARIGNGPESQAD